MELKTKDITKLQFNNNRFSLTNGRLFLLGILEENAIKDKPVLIAHSETDDKVLFNPLFTILKANDQLLTPKLHKPIEHFQSYQLEEDVLYRSTTYLIDGVKITIESERFIDKEEMLIYVQYKFRANGTIMIDLYHGIDDTSIVPNHGIKSLKSKLHEMTLKTDDNEYMGLVYSKNFRHINRNDSNQPSEHYIIEAIPRRNYTLTKVIGYGPRVRRLKKLLMYKLNQSYKKNKRNHILHKRLQLQAHKMEITNNKKLDVLMSYVFRQHLNQFPKSLSLNQTGFENYTQIYLYLLNEPKLAKQRLLDQINNLKQYKKDAKSLGYQGAIIIESLSDFKNGHRSIYQGALLIYLLDLYQEMTNDFSLNNDVTLELAIEVLNFYLDYGEYDQEKNQFDFNNVSNSNHTLNHINNHTLTNYLVHKAVIIVKSLIKTHKNSIFLNRFSEIERQDFLKKLTELQRKVFILKPDENHLIYPYQNFLMDQEEKRLEIEGESLNIFLDQFFLFIVFSQDFNAKIINDNIEYFNEQTRQSYLNQVLITLVSDDIISDEDYHRYIDSLSLYKPSLLINKDGLDYGLMGLIYLFMTYRLSGLRYANHNFMVDSLLPKDIRRLEFEIKYRQFVGSIKIKRNSGRLEWKY